MSANSASLGGWIPLMDYAMKKGVSLSTLRRYIKANKIRFKSEQGRYLIWDEDASAEELTASAPANSYAGLARVSPAGAAAASAEAGDASQKRIEDLELKLRHAQEEISELKMLVALYEEQIFQKPSTMQI